MTQTVNLTSPLGDKLLFKSMELSEELGRLFHCEVELYSTEENVKLEEVLGHDMTIEIELRSGAKRYVHGFVTEIGHTGRAGRYATYTATLRPWLWFLTRTADCRIFQEMTAPDIIKKVFEDAGFSASNAKWSLTATYRQWEYCVQYRESAFNFVSRLMEQEGIYYYFEHAAGEHKLVLADAPTAHSLIEGYEKIPYQPPSDVANRPEHVYDWEVTKSVQTSKYRLNAYSFVSPRLSLEAKSTIAYSHPHNTYEYFDYPGEHYEPGEGNRYVGVRMEEIAAQHERVIGRTDAMGLYPGGLFELTDYPRDDQNREYVIVAVHHQLISGAYETGASADKFEYTCGFEAMPSQVAFRTERVTQKPAMQGPQTAIVVGPGGDEINTDKYGRVKVQFRWDSKGKNDEKSSCWVRVTQAWAGAGWGGMTIPRIGQEVVVDFIEGDPDRPIVTGRVYNAVNMPAYTLPQHKTRSTIISRSTPEGGPDNFNEIRFEDKKGEEEIYIHAEKDQNVIVENNQVIKVGFDKKDAGDRMISVHNDELIEIGRDRNLDVGRDKSETVGQNKTIEVKGSHSEEIAESMTISIAKNLTENVTVNYSEIVGAAMEITVGGALSITAGGAMTEAIGGRKSVKVAGEMSLNVGKDLSEVVGENKTVSIKKDLKETVDGQQQVEIKKDLVVKAATVQLVANDEITLKSGDASIVMKKNGDITIKGKKIEIKGSGDVVVKGSKIAEN